MAVSRQVTTAWKRSTEGFHELNDTVPQRKARKRACAPIAEQQPLPSPRRFVSLRACSSAADVDADPTPADDCGGLESTVQLAPPPIAVAASSALPAHRGRCDTPADGDEPVPEESERPSAGCRCPPSGDLVVRASPRASLRRHPRRSQGAAAAGRCQAPSASSRERAEEHEIQSSSQLSSSASVRSASACAVSSQPLPLGSCSSGDCLSNSYEAAGRGDVWRTFVMQQHKGRYRVLARKVRRVRYATYHKSAPAASVKAEREKTPARHDRASDDLLQTQLPEEVQGSRQLLGACEEAANDNGLLRQQQSEREQEANDSRQQTSTGEEETDDDTLTEPKQGRRQHVKLVGATWVHQSPIANESLVSCVSLGSGADGSTLPSVGSPEAVLTAPSGTSRSHAAIALTSITDAATSEHAAIRDVGVRDSSDDQTASASAAASPDHRPPVVSAGVQAYHDESIVMTQWSLPASIASGTIDCATPAAAADLHENGGRSSCRVLSPAQSSIPESVVISELPTQNDGSSALALCHPGVLCNCADRHRRDVQPPTSGLPVDALPCNCSSIDLDISLPLVLGEPCEEAGLFHSGTGCSIDSNFLPKRPNQLHDQIAPAARRPRTVRGGLAQRLLKVISRNASARAVRSHDLRSVAAESGDQEHSSSGLVLEVLRESVDADGVPVATCQVVGGNSTSVGIGDTVAVVLHDFVAIAKQSCGLPIGTIIELCSPWTVIQSSNDAPLLVSSSFYNIRGGLNAVNRERSSVDIEPVCLGTRSIPTALLQIVQCTCIDVATPARTVLPCDANVLYTGMFSCL